jgi:DNA-binding MarR family transcriptional regulator
VYRRNICGLFDRDEFKFTKTQQLILMTLWLHKKLSLTELSEQICTSNEQATRAVGQLVKMGYVSRVKNENNRREIEISLTEAAEKVVKDAKEKATKRVPENIQSLDDEDAKTICECIDKIGEIIKKMNY